MLRQLFAFVAMVAAARAQQACTLTQETHPSMSWQKCSAPGACSNVAGTVTIDANWRWTHGVASSTNCYTGSQWNSALCPNNAACAANRCVDSANYQATYGATTSGSSLSLKYVTKTPDGGTNVGSRLYLMQDENNYEMFKLLGNEFTFDVDVSQLGCA